MKSSLFDSFKKNLYDSYPYLKNYQVLFEHIGDDEYTFDFFLTVNYKDSIVPKIDELTLITKDIKNFAKLYLINVVTLSDFRMSASTVNNIYL